MTGPKQLALAARGVGVAWVLIGLLWPIAYPLSLLLDLLFGHEGVKIYTRNELAALLHVQREVAEKEGRGGALTPTESVSGGPPHGHGGGCCMLRQTRARQAGEGLERSKLGGVLTVCLAGWLAVCLSAVGSCGVGGGGPSRSRPGPVSRGDQHHGQHPQER